MIALCVNILRLTVWLAVLAMVFVPLERLFSGQEKTAGREHTLGDLGLYFLNNIVPNLLLAIPLGMAAGLAHHLLHPSWKEAVAGLPVLLRLALMIVIGDIGAYWGHRLMHAVPFLWRLHAVHHEPETVDWLVNTHAHPFDVAFQRLCSLTPVYLIGLAQPAKESADLIPILVTLIGSLWSFFIHANIRVRMGVFEYLLSTPAFHHWHHASEPVARNKNYSALLPWVDALFGTLHLPKMQWPRAYGTEEPRSPGLMRKLLQPFTA
jgi:sterol desaturase/sphingolipid hydroxylase (fatty acid hydroxylase superfamily)